jgi:hypothetical protein
VNIRFADIAEQLEGEGVQKFAEALEQSQLTSARS